MYSGKVDDFTLTHLYRLAHVNIANADDICDLLSTEHTRLISVFTAELQ